MEVCTFRLLSSYMVSVFIAYILDINSAVLIRTDCLVQ